MQSSQQQLSSQQTIDQQVKSQSIDPTPSKLTMPKVSVDETLQSMSNVQDATLGKEATDVNIYSNSHLITQQPIKQYHPIVETVLRQLEEKERRNKLSVVEQEALKAEMPYKTISMSQLGASYEGPPKYLSQRDAPLEIPVEVVKKLFTAMDVDMDDRISKTELLDYIQLTQVPISDEEADQIFEDASSNRAIVHKEQKLLGLTFEEIQYAVRGRFMWDTANKKWGVSYKPFRNFWILLMLTVNQRLFALQNPKIIPGKIVSQYEEQDNLKKMQESLMRGELTYKRKEGIERKYLNVADFKEPIFERNQNKIEANVKLDLNGSLKFQDEKKQQVQLNPYELQVNNKIQNFQFFKKISFTTKEYFDQANHLCQQIPHWKNDSQNPIYQFVPESEKPFKSSSNFYDSQEQSLRMTRLQSLSIKNQRPTLQLAGTIALQKRECSPQSKIRQRKGFVTATRVPDIFEDKTKDAIINGNQIDLKTGKPVRYSNEYSDPKNHIFRDEKEIEIGMKDFELRVGKINIENPHGLSVFEKRPKFLIEKEKEKALKKEIIEKFLAANKPHDWIKYYKLAPKIQPLSSTITENQNNESSGNEKSQFLEKDPWIPAYLELARTMKDDFVYGKPKLDLYYLGLKSEHKDVEFDGTKKPFQLIK